MAVRVLWVIKCLQRGGAERLVVDTAARIDRTRYQVEVATMLGGSGGLAPELASQDVRVIDLQGQRTVEAGWPRRLGHLLATGRYPIVHTHSPLPAAMTRVMARAPTRLIHTEHNVWGCYRWPTYACNAATYRRNTAVIAVSGGVADSIVRPRWAPGDYPATETLHHGVDLARSHAGPAARALARTRLGLEESRPVVGTVASFSAKKDHAGLVAAIDRLRRRIPDVVLLLIGEGPLEGQVRADVEARALGRQVRFLGSRDDVLELLPGLDLFVLGSRFEGLPISLLEAMAAGLPCVATRVGGVPEAIHEGVHGRLVPPGEPAALEQAMHGLLTDPPARALMGQAALARARRCFSVEAAAQRIQSLYDEVRCLDGPRGSAVEATRIADPS